MRRASRLGVALALGAAFAVAVDWGVAQLSLEKHRASIERELSTALGRELRLAGELRLDLFPQPALEATEVIVANPPGRASPDLLRIEGLRLVLALWPLLERRLQLVRLQVHGAELRLEADAGGSDELLASIARLFGEEASAEGALAIRIDRIDLDEIRISWLDVASGDHDTLDVDALEIVTGEEDEPIEWKLRGSFRGGRFGMDGSGGTLAGLLHPSGAWPLALEGHAGEASVRIHGQIEQPTRLEGLDLDVEVELPDIGSLLASAPVMPALGAARLRGHLSDPDGIPGLDRIVVESHPDAELRLRVEGSVRKLADPSGIELDGEIEADQLRLLELLVERPLPEGRLRGKFQLSDRDGTIGVEGEAHAESLDGSLQVDLAGGFDDLRAVDELDAKLRVAAPALDMLGNTAGLDWELPALGPVVASGRVRARAGSVGVDGLVLDVGRRGETWLSLRGSVRDLQAFRGVALDASAGARSLAVLGRSLRPERSLPELGPFDLRAKVADARGPLAVQHFELRGGTPATLAVELTGKLADLRQLDAIELEGRLQTRDAARLGSLVGIELPLSGPVRLDGRARGSDERIDSDGSAELGQTRIEGHWSAEIAGRGRPRIVATLRSPHLHLEDIGLGPQRAADASDADESGSRWSPREPLPFDELRRLDARLELSAERVTAGSDVEVRDARASVELDDGLLRLRDVGLEYQGGRIAGELRIDAQTPDPKLALRADVGALDLTRLGVALGRAEHTGSGELDLALDLASAGTTLQALWQRLDGRAAFAARDWSSASEHARRFLRSLSRAFLPELRKGPERLGCFRGALQLAAGVATVESLVLASERATIVGAGTIDLVRERWQLDLVPEVHDAGLLEIASAVRMTGPLANPRFDPIPLDLVAGTLRGLVRGALLPAKTVTSGAQRVLGPLGKVLAPLRSGLRYGARETEAEEAAACVLPQQPSADHRRP